MEFPHTLSLSRVLLDDVVVEILSWLPVRSLLRFRCVSKCWKSLISNSQFVKLHLQRSATNADFAHLRLMFEWNLSDLDKIFAVSCSLRSLLDAPLSIATEQLKPTYMIAGSCNGLFCLLGIGFEECWVRLWNPATRSRSQKSPSFYLEWRHQFAKSGFGYDHLSDTYKVVVLLYNSSAKEDSRVTEVKIYSTGDDCWRSIRSFPAVPTLRHNHGMYLYSTLNWLAVSDFSSGYQWDTVTNDRFVIVSLDLGKETCTQLLLPHIPGEVPHVEPGLRILNNCLCVYYDYKRTHFVLWQMKEFGVDKSWTQLLNISYVCLRIHHLELDDTLIPLWMCEDGNVMIVSKFIGSQAILYNWRDNRLKCCQIPDNINWIKAKLYVESLVSPCSRVA